MVSILCLCFIVIGCNQPTSGSGDPSSPASDGEIEEMLEGLGFTLDDSEPVDDNGNPVGGRNPLGKYQVTLRPKHEVFLAGVGDYNNSESYLRVGAPSGLTHLQQYTNDSWMDLPKKSINADMDGDGFEEIITVAFDTTAGDIGIWSSDYAKDLELGRERKSRLVKSILDQDYVKDLFLYPNRDPRSYNAYFRRDVTAGDFNNDGKTEVIFSVSGHVFLCEYSGGYEVTEIFSGLNGNRTRVEAGYLNRDNYCDLVIVNGEDENFGQDAHFYVYSGGENGLGLDGSSDPVLDCDFTHEVMINYSLSCADVVFADVDGNGYEELVFGGVRTDDRKHLAYFVLDAYEENHDNFQYVILGYNESLVYGNDNSGDIFTENYMVPRVVAGDFNGNGKDEFGILDYFFTYNAGSGLMEKFSEGVFDFEPDGARHHEMFYDVAAVGDVTGDGIDDLVFMEAQDLPWWDKSSWWATSFHSVVVWGKNTIDGNGELAEIHREELTTVQTHPTLCLANVNKDSLVLRYNMRQLHYTEPQILTVLASPPYNAYMDPGSCTTTYDTTEGTTTDYSKDYGFHVGASVGISGEINVGVIDFIGIGGGYAFSTEQEFAWGWHSSATSSTTYGDFTSGGTDLVIVAMTPIDVYVYDVISKPEGSKFEETMTISIPRKDIQKLPLSVDDYNDCVSEELQIPDELLEHTIGDPDSYYSPAERDEIETDLDGNDENYLVYIGEPKAVTATPTGTGGYMTLSEESGAGSTYSYSNDYTSELTLRVFMVDITASAGYRYSYNCESFSFEGFEATYTIGSLDNDAPREARFGWGPMIIPRSFNNQQFDLVTYWVNPTYGE